MTQHQDLAAEKTVLAGILRHGQETYLDIADILQVETFTDKTNQAIYKCILRLFEDKKLQKIDDATMYTIANELDYGWLFDDPIESKYIANLMHTVFVDPLNVPQWAAKIRKLQVARLMVEQLDIAKDEYSKVSGDESFDAIIAIAENRIFDFSTLMQDHDEVGKMSRLGEGLRDYLINLKDNPVEMVGISTGMPCLDTSIGGGLRRKSVGLLGARTGVGKGQTALNITLHISGILQIPVLYLDTEMGKEDHWNRSVANKSGVDINLIETGKFGESDERCKKVFKAIDELENICYEYVNVSGKAFEQTITIMRKFIHQKVGFDEFGNVKDCLIIYDYLKTMSSGDIGLNLNEYQTLGFQMTSLHNFAVRHDCPILTFVQLNRDGIDKETTAAASGSDRIVWLCSWFALLKPKSDEEIAEDGRENGNVKIVPLKCRHGAGLQYGDYISLHLDGSLSRVIEVDTKFNLKLKKNSQLPVTSNPESVGDGPVTNIFDYSGSDVDDILDPG